MPTAQLVPVSDAGYVLVVCGQPVGPMFKTPAAALDFVRDYLFGAAA